MALRTWGALLLLVSAWLCGCGTPEPSGPLPGYEPDPELYATEEFELVEVDPDLPRIAVNLVLVQMVEGAERSEVERLAGELGGEIVGQFPALRAYQIDVGTSTVDALDAKLATAEADASVEAVGYDLEAVAFGKELDLCPPPSDDNVFDGLDRCPFDDIDYYNALSILKRMEREAGVDRVLLGIVDNGFKYTHGQFTTATLSSSHSAVGVVDERVAPSTSAKTGKASPHGTQTAGIMIAANDLVGKNGLFSPFANERHLILGKNVGTIYDMANRLQHVSNAGAKVINVSMGIAKDINDVPAADQAWWRLGIELGRAQMILTSGKTLYVASAPYTPGFLLDGANAYPAGLGLDNLITVGATEVCDPQTPEPGSSWGNIDIWAQGNNFPRLDLNSNEGVILSFTDGHTSMAAPQVASLAGVLYSIHPNLSPAKIRDYILDDAAPGPVSAGGRYLDLARPMARAFYDRSELGTEAKKLLDSDGNGLDPTGAIVGRLCGALDYTIEKVGSKTMTGTDIAREGEIENGADVVGFLQALGFGWTMDAYDARTGLMFSCPGCAFEIDELAAGSEPGNVQVAYTRNTDTQSPEFASATSGTFEIESCEIIERADMEGDPPLIMFVNGEFDIDLDYLPPGAIMPEGRKLDGAFELPFILNPLPDDPSTIVVETLCKNGKAYDG